MNVNINKKENNKVELEVEVPAPQMKMYFDSAASELSKDMNIKGFRPGKVPANIVEKEKGSQALYNQAANIAIQKTLPKILLEKELEVIGQPEISVNKIVSGGPMMYKAVFSTIPEVKLGKYKGLKIKQKKVKIGPKEIDQSLKYLQQSRAKTTSVDRPAKKGDQVQIDFVTRHKDNTKVKGGESKNYTLNLGQGKFIPGFEEKLEKMKAGDKKSFSLKAPKDWPQKNLAGKDLNFEVKLNTVQEKELPELSDKFAKSLGNFQSLDQLKKNIEQGIAQEKQNKEQQRIKMELIKKASENTKVEIPQALIDSELNKMVQELKANVQKMGLEFNKYLEQIKKSPEDLKKEWKQQAKQRVRTALTLNAIAKKEDVEATDQEVEQKMNEILKNYPNPEEAKKNIDLNALKNYTKNAIKNEKVFQLLEREANIS